MRLIAEEVTQTSYIAAPARFPFLSISSRSGLRALRVHLLSFLHQIWLLRPTFCQGVKTFIKHHLVEQLVSYAACPGKTTSVKIESIKSCSHLSAGFDSQGDGQDTGSVLGA